MIFQKISKFPIEISPPTLNQFPQNLDIHDTQRA